MTYTFPSTVPKPPPYSSLIAAETAAPCDLPLAVLDLLSREPTT